MSHKGQETSQYFLFNQYPMDQMFLHKHLEMLLDTWFNFTNY